MSQPVLPGEVVESAAAVLSEHFGTSVTVSGHDVLRDDRSKVARLVLEGAPVGTAILKLAGEARELLWNEYAGLAYLSGLPERLYSVPAFYGGHRDVGFVTMEDYGEDHSLADVLLHGDATTARRAMFGYVDALLAVHLATFDRTDDYAAVRASLPAGEHQQGPAVGQTWEMVTSGLSKLDGGPDTSVAGPALEWIAAAIEGRPAWHAFTVNDCCPDNNHVQPDGRMRLFDLEFSHIRHVLVDLAYVRTTMPTCWCLRKFPAGLDVELVAHYRDRLLAGRPELSRADFDTGLAAAEAYLALVNLSWHLDRAVEPGGAEGYYIEHRDFHLPSRRQMVLLRLDELTATAGRQPELAPFGTLAGHIRAAAKRAWGPVEPLPLYPAFSRPSP